MKKLLAVGLYVIMVLLLVSMFANVGRLLTPFYNNVPVNANDIGSILTSKTAWTYARIINGITWIIILGLLVANNEIRTHKKEAVVILGVTFVVFVVGSIGNGLIIPQLALIVYGVVIGLFGALVSFTEANDAWSAIDLDKY